MLASLLTLYGGLIFVQSDAQLQPLSIGFYVVIMIVNARFLILWTFCMLTVFKSRRYPGMLAMYIKRMFCLIIDEVGLVGSFSLIALACCMPTCCHLRYSVCACSLLCMHLTYMCEQCYAQLV